MQKEAGHFWYSSWFDSPFYHILYKDRDYAEAEEFMNHLTSFLKLPKDAEILDLACGRGRHSIYLNALGYNVIGADLSESSISFAKQFENDTLKFKQHDMCLPFSKKFDAVLNLFTSFGYFEQEEDNLRTIKAIKRGLKKNGFAVIDFFNIHEVIQNLVPKETKVVDGIRFNIEKSLQNDHIIKKISFSHEGADYNFMEEVRALSLEDFKVYFKAAGVTLKEVFGDYQLNEYEPKTSPRLILIFS